MAGVFLPILFDFHLYSETWKLKQRHFAGILSVGFGDGVAALVGSKFVLFRFSQINSSISFIVRYGHIPWPYTSRKNQKTIEGSLCMFVIQILIAEILFGIWNAKLLPVALAILNIHHNPKMISYS